MRIRRYSSASAFLGAAEPWLLRAEAENNVALGIARRVRAEADDASSIYWATVERNGDVVGCAFRTPPHRVRITTLPPDAAACLVEDVHEACGRVTGVGGPVAEAERFAEEWALRFRAEWRVRMRLRLHVLTRVIFPEHPPDGELRPAAAEELPLVLEWTRNFVRDVDVLEDPERLALRLLASGRLYFWDDGGPRCMVAAARDTPSGVCVNAVYTPREERRRGYATVAVAVLSRLLLADGYRFCCLYTDLSNATSNAIYRRIGYEARHDEVDIDFG
ncbi:MAG TPA: GNAT family N-acetyltransferase [Gammaproteobacteria bacterium]